MKISYIEGGLLVVEHGEIDKCLNKLIMFDLDMTLISKNTGQTSKDWEYLFPQVPMKIRELSKQGYFIGIASNQSQLIRLNVLEEFVEKVCNILADLDAPIVFLAALERNEYRKPSTGMYEYICREYVDESKITKKIYVGDAVNSSLGPGHTNSCDSKFAHNAGMEFKHPDEFFRGTKLVYFHENFDIRKYREGSFETDGEKKIIFVFGRKKHCGKRFFAKKYFPNHRIINEKAFSNIQENCILINCGDRHLIETIMARYPEQYSMYYLNYPNEVMNYLKTLAVLSGEKEEEFVPLDACTFSIIEKYGVKVPFIFDSSGFDEKKTKLSRMQL
ncbi:DNA 3'-phosphatase [Encephalitozoon intestinalis ATCC 50506]|uniref:DNA 3'-phosphatase n=1 Tax=Encephalitozoon intestinalis (strain ATCC 50506) TaxID=876142 RepID=E0S7T9_ENCIT|nr:DNA 3'-phosphatase [Encephalitozoon intestinalis ATCC 50506]ADM11774.1 DNA 3'-phosphatase [Encephalitozoon intestinalis ATCC 50506]UTX45522.1 DNA 3'-phosphatase [Encephalitozoon intestinalis]